MYTPLTRPLSKPALAHDKHKRGEREPQLQSAVLRADGEAKDVDEVEERELQGEDYWGEVGGKHGRILIRLFYLGCGLGLGRER
jgi:hypothetical protein